MKLFKAVIDYFKKEIVLLTIFFVLIPGLVLDGWTEYAEKGFHSIVFLIIFIFVFMSFGLTAFYLKWVSSRNLLAISAYLIIISSMISVSFLKYDKSFDAVYYFFKIELIITLLMFTVGIFSHYKHIPFIILLNFIFLGSFISVEGFSLSFPKFLFFGIVICGGGLITYFSQKFTIHLSKRIKKANTIITDRNQQLKEMNLSKDSLLKIIGHDLRTPFFQIQNLIELYEESKDKEEKDYLINLIKESNQQGSELLENLLKWQKKNAHQHHLELESSSIYPVVNEVFKFLRLKSKSKNISLINNLPGDLQIFMNRPMMATVMRNLINNAIKFSHQNSEIIVRSKEENEQIKIEIIDRGVGISEEHLLDLLKGKQNLTTKGTADELGTGQGLYIAKDLVERQNGQLTITSKKNKGTTVSLIFPLLKVI